MASFLPDLAFYGSVSVIRWLHALPESTRTETLVGFAEVALDLLGCFIISASGHAFLSPMFWLRE